MKASEHSKGFTLIELIIVITIIGVVSAFAVPNYTRYVSKAQVNRVYQEASAYQRIIDDKLGHDAIDGVASDPEGVLGFIDSNLTSITFGTFQSEAASTITATLDGESSAAVRDAVMTLSRSVFGVWSCAVSNTGPGWESTYTPSACR